MTLPSWLERLTGKEDLWIVEVFVVVLLTLLAAFAVKVILGHLVKRAENTKNLWDDALLCAASQPLKWFIWLVGLSWAAEIAGTVSESVIFSVVDTVRRVGVIVVLSWFIVRFIVRAEKNLMDPDFTAKPMDETTVLAIGKLLRISVIVTAGLVILQSFGYSVSGVLAFGGIGGLAVGFAAKDLLANFFGGLMIYLDRPFAVGDWIRSPDRDIEGTVEDIGWRLTRIRTFDKRPLYVPNATFTHISLENPSRMYNRRIKETIGIRYDDAGKMATIIPAVKEMLASHPEIDTEQTLIVNFNSFAPYSLDFFIYTFTKTTDWVKFHDIKQDVLLKVLEIIEAQGAECAFPTSTVHIPDDIHLQNPDRHSGNAPGESKKASVEKVSADQANRDKASTDKASAG
ncbi:mechanosensitive ion channel family protein [Exilibacterium tricleocarpae]|uniref:Mechanosensitive ion channel family protein n=1 Tax=Exilibacterium tricleocarpae TaxID=2591008 RepID=A0A545TVW2_9GAMM|nr:mechanosensitive ion channel family protein [Exilibacterium tricleocarpae]TQV81357.1 mechanosensitive ion channel family protein [Exilibacterium tricleocarpae]